MRGAQQADSSGQAALLQQVLNKVALRREVREALATVERGAFVGDVWVSDGKPRVVGPPAWRRIRSGSSDWFAKVYHDDALITHLGGDGLPISSSTMPSLMGIMLNELRVRSSSSVFEIGTGTGYNAALLARIADKGGEVVTVDVDEGVLAEAIRNLASIPNVQASLGDITREAKTTARYDRIIATAGLESIPLQLLDKLQPKGRLVVSLQPPLVSSLLCVERETVTRDQFTGRFFGQAAGHFMPLRHETGSGFSEGHSALSSVLASESHTYRIDARLHDAIVHAHRGLLWLIQVLGPDLRLAQVSRGWDSDRMETVIHRLGAAISLSVTDTEAMRVYAGESVLNVVRQAYATWAEIGSPQLDDYLLTIDREGDVRTRVGDFELSSNGMARAWTHG